METVGRIFVGVPLAGEARAVLAERIKGLEIPGRVVPPENWHITLRFLGWLDPVSYEKYLRELTPVSDTNRFRIRLDRLGAFPNMRRATVVWVGVDAGGEQLGVLNELAESAAVSVGLSGEERPFHPHLTLSRVRPPEDVRSLEDEPVDIRWRCDQVVVFRSHLGGGGARYEPLETFALIR